jgi:hypothetical protein
MGIKAKPTEAELLTFGKALFSIIESGHPREIVLVNARTGQRAVFTVSAVRQRNQEAH